MKRIEILAVCLAAGATDATDNEPAVLYPGTVCDVDDNTAGLLIVAGKAKAVPKDTKVVDTSKAHLKAADERAKAAADAATTGSPEAMAKLVAAAVASALAAQAKPAPAAS